MRVKEIFKEDIFTKNPIYVLLLGMCPSLAITTSIENALGMMVAVTLVLVFSNLIVSLIRKLIDKQIRLPVYIIIIATLVTCVSLLIEAYAYPIHTALGIFLPLITVNCIVLGRAEAFASKNNVKNSVIDGLASGIGFGLGLISIAFVRELFGTGTIVFHNIFGDGKVIFDLSSLLGISEFTSKYCIPLLTKGAGAFLVFGLLMALVNLFVERLNKKINSSKEVITNA